jgi:hypothetical protein
MVRTLLARAPIRVRTPALEQVKGYVRLGMDKCTHNSGGGVVDSRPWALVLPVLRCCVRGMLIYYDHFQTRRAQMSSVLRRNL